MGDVVSLQRHRYARAAAARRSRRERPRATFFFDLASPYTYLAAERAERLFCGLEWRPALATALHAGEPEADRELAHRRADLLRLPLVWPERAAPGVPAAMRVASLAAERGCGAAFVLAASRLAFCGGFDVDDPEILAEAAAAANLGLDECLAAAGDVSRDGTIEDTGRRLLAAGADRLPALRIGRLLFCGEDRIAEAAAAARTAV